ncbi:hypothetical protein ANCCAN_18145 [Ancylostoma caninum]|uniref:Uncharacterized protein n=1 Tax=Ancylostoma caninum TaxID=29170 RepID=A0A368FYZ5_ANCCA|nr:hypothetical protein ANCCAN_18145 [Ancylostoma caninum]
MADLLSPDENSGTLNTCVTSTEGPSQVQSVTAPPNHEQQEDDESDVHIGDNNDVENQAEDLLPPLPPPQNRETVKKSNTGPQVSIPVISLKRQDPRYGPNICGDSSDGEEELQWYRPKSRQSSPESESTRELPVATQTTPKRIDTKKPWYLCR